MTGAIGYLNRGGRWLPRIPVEPGRGWAVVLGWTLFLFFGTNFLLSGLPWTDVSVYLLQPLLWLSLGVLAFRLGQQEGQDAALRPGRWLLVIGLLVGLFQLALFLLAGVLFGFGNSPYARSPLAIVLNLWFAGAQLFGLEMARWYLVTALSRRSALLGFVVPWLLIALVSVSPATWARLSEAGRAFTFAGQTIFPTFAENLLATYLALTGGPFVALAYRGTLDVFEWVSPVMPNLMWTLTAFLGTVAPALGLLIARDLRLWRAAPQEQPQVQEQAPGAEQSAEPSSSGLGWVLAMVVGVFLFWFSTGMFGFRPALITGISMEPTMYAGDLAITREVAPSTIEVGDIVRFQSGQVSILHRVKEIQRKGTSFIFTTYGDNTEVIDAPWDASRLEGKLVLTVPKVGWAPLMVQKLIGRVQ